MALIEDCNHYEWWLSLCETYGHRPSLLISTISSIFPCSVWSPPSLWSNAARNQFPLEHSLVALLQPLPPFLTFNINIKNIIDISMIIVIDIIITFISRININQSCKNMPTVPTSRCYFFWPVLIFGKSTRKTVLLCPWLISLMGRYPQIYTVCHVWTFDFQIFLNVRFANFQHKSQ